MKVFDILGREVKENDLVVVKNITRVPSKENQIIIGVYDGKNVRVKGSIRNAVDMFLIENPTETEMMLKEAILKEMATEQEMRKRKMGVKVKTDANVVGKVYRISREDCVVYCGKKKVSVFKNDKLQSQKEGHFYINIGHYLGDNVIAAYKFDDFLRHAQNVIERVGHSFNEPVKEPHVAIKEYQTVQVPKTFEIDGTYIQKWLKEEGLDHQISTRIKVVVEEIG